MITLAKKSDCTGCKACSNVCAQNAISFPVDDEGFGYPIIDINKCVECGLCQNVCPQLHLEEIEWKPEPKCYASFSYKHQREGSSGGVFSALADFILDHGGFIYGAVFDENYNLYHTGSNRLDEVALMRGSKYLQSDIKETFKEVRRHLINNEWVLFTGTPCQIDGLNFFLRHKSYGTLITADVICHGVPSQGAFSRLIDNLKSLHGSSIENFRFRKLDGWSMQCRFLINGTEKSLKYDMDTYMQAFYKGYLFREGCYRCKYAQVNRCSDITLADFWGIGSNGKAFRKSVTHGISLVLGNTPKGNNILKEMSEKEIFLQERSLEEGVSGQHNLKSPSPRPGYRCDSAKDFINMPSFMDYAIKYNLLPKHKYKYFVTKAIKDKFVDWGVFDMAKGIFTQIKNRL